MKKNLKRIFSVLLALVLVVGVVACSTDDNADADTGNTTDASAELEELKVGVAFFPMGEILELIQDDMAEEGYEIVIEEFTEYQTPNNLMLNNELDANMIQHQYFLEQFNEANDSDLVIATPIYHATFALYSQDYTSLDEIPDGALITVPDDATNLSRAIYLLEQAGLITIAEGKTVGLTLDDIVENPKNLDLTDQVPLTSLAQRYEETGLGIMYPTYARSLELEGDEQRLYVEEQDEVTEGYAISLASRADNVDSEAIQTLIDNLYTDEVRQFLIDEYSWAATPAF